MESKLIGFIFLTTILGGFKAEAFTCYKCNSNGDEHNPLCIEDPEKLASATEECDKFCTILRTEYTDIPGEIVSLVRGCETEPIVENGVRTDKHYTKMYTSCNTDRCNSGDGKRLPGEGNDGRTGPKDVIIVYESNSSWMTNPSFMFTLGAVGLFYFLQSKIVTNVF